MSARRRIRVNPRRPSTLAALLIVLAAACGESRTVEVAAPVTAPDTVIRIIQGNGARLIPGAQVDTIIAWVTDRQGNSRNGIPIAWSVTLGGGTVRSVNDATIETGFARAIW